MINNLYISLSSCLSKLFTGLLQNRLITHLENNNFFRPFQAGFRPDHRTTDHIFGVPVFTKKTRITGKTTKYRKDLNILFNHIYLRVFRLVLIFQSILR